MNRKFVVSAPGYTIFWSQNTGDTESRATQDTRFLPFISDSGSPDIKMQQRWIVCDLPVGFVREEWRDVPTVTE